MVEEWDARLERVGHRRAVDLDEHVVREVPERVGHHHPLGRLQHRPLESRVEARVEARVGPPGTDRPGCPSEGGAMSVLPDRDEPAVEVVDVARTEHPRDLVRLLPRATRSPARREEPGERVPSSRREEPDEHGERRLERIGEPEHRSRT